MGLSATLKAPASCAASGPAAAESPPSVARAPFFQ
jgi:hypothetical protein